MAEVDVLLLQLVGRVWLEGEVYAPIGMSYLAASLRAVGYRVETAVVDPDGGMDLPMPLRDSPPRLLGLSATGNEIAALKRLSVSARMRYPDMPIVAGGYCSLDGAQLFTDSALDVVVLGEGEVTIRDLADTYLRTGAHGTESLDHVPGILWRDKHGRVRTTGPREPVASLDQLPAPDYRHIPSRTNSVRVYASRGCPYDCRFCEIKDFYSGRSIRRHGGDYMRALIERLIAGAEAPIEVVYFNDDEFLLTPEHLETMAEVVRGLGIRMCFQTRTPDILRHHRAIASNSDVIFQIHLGVESFSQSQLDRWRKRTKVEQNIEALGILADLGVSYYPYLILSDAHTTIAEIEATCAGILAMPPCRCEVRIDGSIVRIEQTPLARGVHLNRMKTFYGDVDRRDETRYLDAVWRYLQLTHREARALSGVATHGVATETMDVRAAHAGRLLNARLARLPAVAAAAGAASPAGMFEVAESEAAWFATQARDARIDYMTGVLSGAPHAASEAPAEAAR